MVIWAYKIDGQLFLIFVRVSRILSNMFCEDAQHGRGN